MKTFLLSLQFLTIFPVKIRTTIQERDFGKALLYFPLIGLLIGAVLSVAAAVLGFLPPLIKAAWVLILSIIISGGIHLDGLADTSDGFYGNKPKERILEIMRDSRIGVMGVLGIVSILLLKFVFMASFEQAFLWKALLMMAAFSRWSQALACSMSSYARREGKGRPFIEYARPRDAIIGGLCTFALFLFLAKLSGVLVFLSALAAVLLFIWYIKGRIGGMTGDTIGATSEIAEVLVLVLSYAY